MKSLHRTPMTILILGIVTVALFGGGVVWISKQTPIVRLHPMLKEQFKNEQIEVRFKPGSEPRIEVHVGAEVAPTRYAMGEIGAWALKEYKELAPRTHVKVCRVALLTEDEEDEQFVDIDSELIGMYERAKRQEPQLLLEAQGAGLKKGSLQILGVVDTGVHVQITGELMHLDAAGVEPIAARIARAVARSTFLSRVTVTLNPKGGKQISTWAGRDRPADLGRK